MPMEALKLYNKKCKVFPIRIMKVCKGVEGTAQITLNPSISWSELSA